MTRKAHHPDRRRQPHQPGADGHAGAQAAELRRPQLYTDPQHCWISSIRIAFDVAIFDHQLPAVNGIELARSVRAHGAPAGKPIVIVTGRPGPRRCESRAGGGRCGVPAQADRAASNSRCAFPPWPASRMASGLAEAHRPQAWTAGPGENDGPPREQEELVSAFARAAGYKDRETPLHATRMACYCAILAHHLGLTDEACAELRLAAPLHDIGKVGLRDEVLQNRGLLSEEQRRHMAEHTRIGHAILSGGRSRVMRLAAEIALTHHERWDGDRLSAGPQGRADPARGPHRRGGGRLRRAHQRPPLQVRLDAEPRLRLPLRDMRASCSTPPASQPSRRRARKSPP